MWVKVQGGWERLPLALCRVWAEGRWSLAQGAMHAVQVVACSHGRVVHVGVSSVDSSAGSEVPHESFTQASPQSRKSWLFSGSLICTPPPLSLCAWPVSLLSLGATS